MTGLPDKLYKCNYVWLDSPGKVRKKQQPMPSLKSINKCQCKELNKGTKVKIPRPRNAFMIFRQQHQGYIPSTVSTLDKSKIIAEQWRNMSTEEKSHWVKLADEEREEHRIKYPTYQYHHSKKSNYLVGVTRKTCDYCLEQEKKKSGYSTHSKFTNKVYRVLNVVELDTSLITLKSETVPDGTVVYPEDISPYNTPYAPGQGVKHEQNHSLPPCLEMMPNAVSGVTPITTPPCAQLFGQPLQYMSYGDKFGSSLTGTHLVLPPPLGIPSPQVPRQSLDLRPYAVEQPGSRILDQQFQYPEDYQGI